MLLRTVLGLVACVVVASSAENGSSDHQPPAQPEEVNQPNEVLDLELSLFDCCGSGLVSPLVWESDLLPGSCTLQLCEEQKLWMRGSRKRMEQWWTEGKKENFSKEHFPEMRTNMLLSLPQLAEELSGGAPEQQHRFRNIGSQYRPEWRKQGIARFKFSDGHWWKEHKAMYRKAMAAWERNTCVVFEEVQDDSYGVFSLHVGVGTGNNWNPNTNEVTCENMEPDIVAHELGHAIGLGHTTRRIDRDKFIDFDEKRCIDAWSGRIPMVPYYTTCTDRSEVESSLGRYCKPKHKNMARMWLKKLNKHYFDEGYNASTIDLSKRRGRRQCGKALCTYSWVSQYRRATTRHKTYGLYEYGSIMHYPFDTCAKKRPIAAELEDTMRKRKLRMGKPGRNGVTKNDLEIVRQYYNCHKLTVRWGAKASRVNQIYVHPELTVANLMRKISKQVFGKGWHLFPSSLRIRGLALNERNLKQTLAGAGLLRRRDGEAAEIVIESDQWEKEKAEDYVFRYGGQRMYRLSLTQLKCIEMEDKTFKNGSVDDATEDEVYLNLYVDGKKHRMPKVGTYKMKKNQVVNFKGRSFKFFLRATALLWEEDDGNLRDQIGQADIFHSTGSPVYLKKPRRRSTQKTAHYRLMFTIQEEGLVKELPKRKLNLLSFLEVEGTEWGNEEVYYKYQVDGGKIRRYPNKKGFFAMKPNPRPLNRTIEFINTVEVRFFEADTFNRDDHLGKATFFGRKTIGEKAKRFRQNGEWVLKYRID